MCCADWLSSQSNDMDSKEDVVHGRSRANCERQPFETYGTGQRAVTCANARSNLVRGNFLRKYVV